MRVVVDTNVIFSAILNSSGLIGEILFNSENQFEFYSPEIILDELSKYKEKLRSLSGFTADQIEVSQRQIFKKIELISIDAIPSHIWEDAYSLAKNVDEKDTPFIATAIGIKGLLWTGDKKLTKGLRSKGFEKVILTSELIDLRK